MSRESITIAHQLNQGNGSSLPYLLRTPGVNLHMGPKGESSNSTSLGLLQGLQANDPDAWQRLNGVYGPLIDYWCRRAQLQEADAADVRQEVFMAVARKIGDFRREAAAGSFRGWLRAITRNKITDLERKRRGQLAAAGGDEQLGQIAAKGGDDEIAKDEVTVESQILYRNALALLRQDFEERTWRAFWSVVIEGRSPSAVAIDLDVSVNVVYLAKSRVLARLREEFAGLLGP
jgi:RNA polymerase sigma-70 factor, ECF subfamily